MTWAELIAVWLAAIAALVPAVIGVQEYWQRRLQPKLAVDVRFTEPDCALITAFVDESPASRTTLVRAYWFRAFVRNTGRTAARELEVIIHNVTKKDNGSWKPVRDFIQSNLSWTHHAANAVYLPMLLPGTSKNFELGYVAQPTGQSGTSFCFQLTVTPSYNYNVLGPGEYEFELTVGAANARSSTRRFRLALSGTWHESKDEMFRKGIRLEYMHRA